MIEEQCAGNSDLDVLLAAAFEELVGRYGQEGLSPVHGSARFMVAYADGRAVGCGALQPGGDPATGELKRMYVIPEYRGRGVASAVLAGLERLAVDLDYRRILLATGVRQPEAISFYQRRGYCPIEPYGKYVGDLLSRCFQKLLPAV